MLDLNQATKILKIIRSFKVWCDFYDTFNYHSDRF